MSKLRFLYDNIANRGVLGSFTPAALSGMPASNMLNDVRGQVARFMGTSVQFSLSFTALELVGLLAIPASNLAPGSTVRVRAYSDAGGTALVGDTGAVPAFAGSSRYRWGFGQVSSVNEFTEGSFPMVLAYLPTQVAARRLTVDITNPNGTFIDISRLVAGPYIETTYTADWGASVGTVDLSSNTRTAAGDLRTDWGPRYTTLQFDLTGLTEEDRGPIRHVISGGIGQWLLFDLLAENPNPELSRAYSIYGKFSQSGAMSYKSFRSHATQLQIDGY